MAPIKARRPTIATTGTANNIQKSNTAVPRKGQSKAPVKTSSADDEAVEAESVTIPNDDEQLFVAGAVKTTRMTRGRRTTGGHQNGREMFE